VKTVLAGVFQIAIHPSTLSKGCNFVLEAFLKFFFFWFFWFFRLLVLLHVLWYHHDGDIFGPVGSWLEVDGRVMVG
jgi:hypothetical protein